MDLSSCLFLPAIYLGLNILAFALFAYDKLRSKMKGIRIPEKSLLLAAALGPFGALTAMMGLRHKTRHAKFLLVVPLLAILHLLLAVWLWPMVAG